MAGNFFQMDLAVDWSIRRRVGLLPGQQLTRHSVFGTEDYVALNEVFQLADVPGPGVFFQELHRRRREGPYLNLVPGSMSIEEIPDQVADIFNAGPQRRKLYVHDVDAVIKVLAEVSARNFLFQIAIGGADYTQLDIPVFLATNSAELSVLQQLKQFGLERHNDFVDPV